jgi:hypothetical protein
MLPVFQPALLLATLELADSDILGHSCNGYPEPVKQLLKHGDLPYDKLFTQLPPIFVRC